VIYHYVNNQWIVFSNAILPDAPVAFSTDNRYLFTEGWGEIINPPFVNIIDISHMNLVRTYKLEGDSDQIFNPIESPDRRAFAVAPDIYDTKTRIQTSILLFGRFDNDFRVELTDESYREVLYWLEGDRQVAALVERNANDYTFQRWMKIVDVPTEFSQ
jgi:hypothetical protein